MQGQIIYQRPADGYVNATAMCLAAGKRWFDYSRLSTTGAFIDELATETGIPASVLVQTLKGGDVTMQGTWVHPQVATHLAQWLSPKFAVLVSRWVVDWMSGGLTPKRAELPYHLRPHIANQNQVPHGHFSMLSEVMIAIVGPMEAMGYTLPERMLPDISMVVCSALGCACIDSLIRPSSRSTCTSSRMVVAFWRMPTPTSC